MAQEKPEHHRKRRQLVWMIVSLLLAAAVIASAIWLRSNRYFYSSESHSLEAFRGLEGKGEVQSPEDSANLARRQELLLNGQAENDAMIGWLVLPGTMIDYPVMGGKDSSRYAEQNYDGKYDKYGTPYLAETCRTDFSDYFSVIYGHNMNNSTMFGSLERFQNADVFADAQDGVLILEDGQHRLTLTASISATATVQALVEDLTDTEQAQPEQLSQLLQLAAVQTPDVSVTEDDRWVLLSTLDYADEKSENGTPSMLLLKLQPA